MKLFLFIVCLHAAFVCHVQARECRQFLEFNCFWSGACIPIKLVCDGKHDCAQGEDETAWFAECNYCKPDEFHCHKDTDRTSNTCIPKDKTCDGYFDCWNGEDETEEFANCTKKCRRHQERAARKGRRKCRKECQKDSECGGTGKACICDYSCGRSCVTLTKTCPRLRVEDVPHLKSIRYITHDKDVRKLIDATEPFMYDAQAHYTCEAGYVPYPDHYRLCHGRGTDEETWTRKIVCSPNCEPRKEAEVVAHKMSCGLDCRTDADCAAGTSCTCDGACGRTCVNLEIECPEAPPIANAIIEYTGEKFERVAHYLCVEGTFRARGDVSRKCTGSGVWDGIPIECEVVYCGNPIPSIYAMGGELVEYPKQPYAYNTTLRFKCGQYQRLLGSAERKCMGNGRWSGFDAVCDNVGTMDRCRHPGIPIEGQLLGTQTDRDFEVGKSVTFRCNEGRVMIGEAQQRCLFYREWSDGGAPQCVDPRYSDSPIDVINKLSASTSNIRPSIKRNGPGRTIFTNAPGGNEVYFLIDLSLSVGETELKNTVSFAISLVKRLSLNDTTQVKYGIIVFATRNDIMLNIHDPNQTPKQVIEMLENIAKDYKNIRNTVKMGTNIQGALDKLDREMLALSYENDQDNNVKRHLLLLSDGRHNAGGSPIEARIRIENAYRDNPPEFYSITSAAGDEDPEARMELQQLATTQKNFIYVEDFYKLHSYVDQVTDAREDYTTCGQAGDVGSVRKMVSVGRVIGGERAAERAWPWQALITDWDEDVRVAFQGMRGGGSIINTKWVLSAAHVFADDDGEFWWESIMIAVGILRRPQKFNQLQGSVKMYRPEWIKIHEDFDSFTLQNDIALIKIGGEYTISRDGRKILVPTEFRGEVTYSPYIRPVCLPCSPDSCVAKVLMKKDAEGKVLLKGNETAEEKCRIEHEFLMGQNKQGKVAVVATGFGHNATREDNDERRLRTTEYLMQGLLEILPKEDCQTGIEAINRQKAIPGFAHIFTEQMICAVGSRDEGKVIDTCKGDSGGPVVREVVDENTRESCFVQLGIVSYGYGCGQRLQVLGQDYSYPGYYANVTAFLTWIEDIQKNYVPPSR